jgi:molecular chaperone DnaK (HSP70)
MEKKYAVGIDLGTSNSALALSSVGEEARVDVLPVTQILSLQTVGEVETLPSVLYLPPESEVASATARLRW